jgi:hypothetical protein
VCRARLLGGVCCLSVGRFRCLLSVCVVVPCGRRRGQGY